MKKCFEKNKVAGLMVVTEIILLGAICALLLNERILADKLIKYACHTLAIGLVLQIFLLVKSRNKAL